jgi:DNA-binding HxlR family transcriptional regulator
MHHGPVTVEKEDGTFTAVRHIKGTMSSRTEKQPDTSGLICKSEESEALRAFLAKVGDKWTVLLIVLLARTAGGRARFSELQRMLDGISQRMLTTTLRSLERDGLIRREVFPEVPPRVEYELTNLGSSLLEPMQHLVDWVGFNWLAIKKARAHFDGK